MSNPDTLAMAGDWRSRIPLWAWLLVGFWAANLVWGSLVVVPHSDDAVYFLPALGFAHTGEIAVHFDGEAFRLFKIFPSYSFLLGLVLTGADVLAYPFHYFSYRFFHIVLVVGLLALSVAFIRSAVSGREPMHLGLRYIVFFLAIGLSPVSRGALVVRPELPGVLFVVAGILLYCRALRNPSRTNWSFYLAALSLGVGATMHPTIAVIAGMTSVGVVVGGWSRFGIGRAAAFLIVAAIPLGFLGAYFIVFLVDFQSQMSNQIDILAPKSGLLFRSATRLIDFAFLLGAKPALSIKLVTAIFYFPFFFATLAAFALAIRTLATRDLRQPLPVAICFMILAAVPILVLERGLSYIHVAFAFPLILGAVSLPWPRLPHIRMANLSGVTARVFVACALLVSGALWNLTHAAKFAVFPGEFLEPRRMLAALNGAMSTVDAVFVARPELAPFLMPAFEEQYHGSTGRLSPRQPEANFLFQALANIGNPEGAARASALIVRRVERHRPERTLWLLAKKNIPSTASDGFCLTLGDGGDILDLSLRFTIAEVLYESNKHVVLRPASVSFGC